MPETTKAWLTIAVAVIAYASILVHLAVVTR